MIWLLRRIIRRPTEFAPAMDEGTGILPGLPPVAGKPVHLAFDGGLMTSDAGILLLAGIEQRLGIAERLAECIEDPRAPERVRHGLAEMIRYRALLIAAGYPDGNDCDALRADPAFKMAVGRLPESGADLCSQPTISRLENLPGATALKRMMAAMVEVFCDSFEQVPRRIVLDIDDTEDRVHGGQQLALFNAYYDSRCFQPIHIYEATTAKPVAIILRPGKTPDGAEVALVLRHVIGHIRARWPAVDIVVRGDSHYARTQAMAWCERKRIGYIFGLAGNAVLLHRVGGLAEDADPVQQHRMAGEAEDVADTLAFAPRHRLRPGVMAVAAHHDVDRRPAGADMADDMAQDQGHLGAVWRLAGAQDDRHRLAGARLINVDRLEAAAVVVGVEQRQLLAAVNPVLGVVDVEHDAPGDLFEAVAEHLDHRR